MRPRIIFNFIFILAILLVLLSVGKTIYLVRTTGVLKVTSDDSSAILAITGLNKQAMFIGEGTANIRLTPGTYLLSATDQGAITRTEVHVRKDTKTTQSLGLNNQLQALNKDNGLLGRLPFVGPAFIYTISYYLAYHNALSSPVIIITSSTPQGKQAAQNWITSLGYNLSSLQIEYVTTQNAPAVNNTYVGGS